MLKDYLDVSVQRALLFLLGTQPETRASLLAKIPTLGLVSKNKLRFKSVAMIDLKEWNDAVA